MSATATNQPNQSRLLVVVQSKALSTLYSLFDNHFECSIYLDQTIEGPNVISECIHRFCNTTCIKKSIQRCGAECPNCRAWIASRRHLRNDQLLGDIVSEKRCGSCLPISFTAAGSRSVPLVVKYY